MINFSDMEHDAIVESFNIGIGSAAAALSEMVEQEIVLTVPKVGIHRRDEVLASLNAPENQLISGVRERFSGLFSGKALLLFPEDRSLELVRLILKEEVALDFLTEMEEEALIEVGNIILNACLGNIAMIMRSEVFNEIPESVKGELGQIILDECNEQEHDYVMQLRMDFTVKEVDISGYLGFIVDIGSLDTFRLRLADYFGFDAA